MAIKMNGNTGVFYIQSNMKKHWGTIFYCILRIFISRGIQLTHFKPIIHFHTPSKHQKTSGTFMFSGGVEMNTGLKSVNKKNLIKASSD